MEKEIIFEAKHMRKEFGPTIALKDVDFTLRRGEIRGLVGENGSGKSTIMSIVILSPLLICLQILRKTE